MNAIIKTHVAFVKVSYDLMQPRRGPCAQDSSSGMSSICLLRYIGFEGQLWQAAAPYTLRPRIYAIGGVLLCGVSLEHSLHRDIELHETVFVCCGSPGRSGSQAHECRGTSNKQTESTPW